MKLLLRKSGLWALLLFVMAGPYSPALHEVDASTKSFAVDEQFELRMLLNQTERVMVIDLVGGVPTAIAGLDFAISFMTPAGLITINHLEPLYLDVLGNAQVVLPLQYKMQMTNFEVEVTAFYLNQSNEVMHSPQMWSLGSLHLDRFSDLAFVNPLAYDALLLAEEANSSGVVTCSPSVLNPGVIASGTSFAFLSLATATDGSFILAGAGNYLVTAPSTAFSVSSGPAGIFTAN